MKIVRLRAVREQHGLTQEELAQRIGLSRSQIQRLEKGGSEPSTETIANLAHALDVSMEYLLGLSEKPNGIREPRILSDGETRLLDAYRTGDVYRILHVLITDEEFKDKHP